jgi:hypothetical protein
MMLILILLHRILNYADVDSNLTRSVLRPELEMGWRAFAAKISEYIRSMAFAQVKAFFDKDSALNYKSCYAVYILHQGLMI